jgi:hypothetical protein
MIFGQDVSETLEYLLWVSLVLSAFAMDLLFFTLLVWGLIEIARVILQSTANCN